MLKILLVVGLLMPGMSAPRLEVKEVATIAECLSEASKYLQVAEEATGKEFIASVACKVTSSKADPA